MRWFHGFQKLRQIAASELAFASKLRYIFDAAMRRFRPEAPGGVRKYGLRGGGSIVLREDATDRKVFEEIFLDRTYLHLAKSIAAAQPAVLIDLGANIGLSAIALARALRPKAIAAVEPDAQNFAMLQENLRVAGIEKCCVTMQAFAGVERGFAELVDSGNGAWGMRMGAPTAAGIPVLPLEEIVSAAQRLAGLDRYTTVLKCDIEGAEAALFRRLRQWEDLIDDVILELHTEFLSAEEFYQSLAASNYDWKIEGTISPQAVLATIRLKRGPRKPVAQSQGAAGS